MVCQALFKRVLLLLGLLSAGMAAASETVHITAPGGARNFYFPETDNIWADK
jgi:hypothetical protein